MAHRIPVAAFLALFTVSGFAGLIYQSIWSHYLKLFLGHAAYAQTLVLAIFMGGMALGAWLVSRATGRVRNLLLGYAIAEACIGVLAIVFHALFIAATDWAFASVIPALENSAPITAFKWTLAGLLILPASILLGTTFPLMSAGIMRLYPASGDSALAWLYFTNSLGAAAGVLASGFFLIDKLGLPGTILTAGLLNLLLAFAVWVLVRKDAPAQAQPAPPRETEGARKALTAVLALAFLTGASSFVYEIAWIRMLSMGLGASTHSFEIMLSAFILGMAVGAWVLAWRSPRTGRELPWLGGVLVAKGVLAVWALAAYPHVLDFILWMMGGLRNSEQGYTLLLLTGHAASLAVMFPAAFCAGMTLPLATSLLIRRGAGEAAIGRVYAANTAGCILGVAFATHAGMEWIGVKGLTGLGAAVDVAVGAAAVLAWTGRSRRAFAAISVIGLAGIVAFASLQLDPLKMASGIFRYKRFLDPATNKVAYYQDGKTATIAVLDEGTTRVIRTNGKPDAGIELDPGKPPVLDESTMVLLGSLPLAVMPDAKNVANIGFGSGLTTHTLLGSPTVASVDTIEIEPAMVEGARLFGRSNERAYSDPRSHIHIEDAKTFFASRKGRYDVIVSEPSNPWVSGVATLFSDEFYGRMRGHLADRGLLVQWIHVYEIDFDLVSSILKALGRNFEDYAIYGTQPGDIVVIATKKGPVPRLTDHPWSAPAMRASLERVGFSGLAMLELEYIASRRVIEPLVDAARYPVNSDYFPVVDQNAARARYLDASSTDVRRIPRSFFPFAAFAQPDPRMNVAEARAIANGIAASPAEALAAARVADTLLGGSPVQGLPPTVGLQLLAARQGFTDCTMGADLWLDALEETLRRVVPIVKGPEIDEVLRRAAASPCAKAGGAAADRIALYKAFHERDIATIIVTSDRLLALERTPIGDRATVVVGGMAARLAKGDRAGARAAWQRYGPAVQERVRGDFAMRLVIAHLKDR